MKKSSFIFLTLVASFSVTLSAAQDTTPKNEQSEFIYEPDRMQTTPAPDTSRRDIHRRDSIYVIQHTITYDYYYRSRFWNGFYRTFAPRRYYRVIHAQGYVPHHFRTGSHRTNGADQSAHIRGGFGRTGSRGSQTN